MLRMQLQFYSLLCLYRSTFYQTFFSDSTTANSLDSQICFLFLRHWAVCTNKGFSFFKDSLNFKGKAEAVRETLQLQGKSSKDLPSVKKEKWLVQGAWQPVRETSPSGRNRWVWLSYRRTDRRYKQ